MKVLFQKVLGHWKKIFILFIGLDLLMLVLHLLFGNSWTFFHLDFEQNLPTLYQSLKLLIFGIGFLMLSLMGKYKLKLKTFLIPLSLLLIFVGLDELLQIHENIYRLFELTDWFHPSRMVTLSYNRGYRSSLWILYYLPAIFIFVFWSGYWLRYFQTKLKSNFKLILICNFLLFLVLLAEILSSMGKFGPNIYFGLVTLEEFSEMVLATILVVIGLKIFKSQSA